MTRDPPPASPLHYGPRPQCSPKARKNGAFTGDKSKFLGGVTRGSPNWIAFHRWPLSHPHLQWALAGVPRSQKVRRKAFSFQCRGPNCTANPTHKNGQSPAPKAPEKNWGLFLQQKAIGPFLKHFHWPPTPSFPSKFYQGVVPSQSLLVTFLFAFIWLSENCGRQCQTQIWVSLQRNSVKKVDICDDAGPFPDLCNDTVPEVSEGSLKLDPPGVGLTFFF